MLHANMDKYSIINDKSKLESLNSDLSYIYDSCFDIYLKNLSANKKNNDFLLTILPPLDLVANIIEVLCKKYLKIVTNFKGIKFFNKNISVIMNNRIDFLSPMQNINRKGHCMRSFNIRNENENANFLFAIQGFNASLLSYHNPNSTSNAFVSKFLMCYEKDISEPFDCDISYNGEYICITGRRPIICVYANDTYNLNSKSGNEFEYKLCDQLIKHDATIKCARFYNDNNPNRIVSCSRDKRCILWDLSLNDINNENSKIVSVMNEASSWIEWIACTKYNNECIFACVTWNGVLYLFSESQFEKPFGHWRISNKWLNYVDFSPNGQEIVVCGADGLVHVYKIDYDRLLYQNRDNKFELTPIFENIRLNSYDPIYSSLFVDDNTIIWNTNDAIYFAIKKVSNEAIEWKQCILTNDMGSTFKSSEIQVYPPPMSVNRKHMVLVANARVYDISSVLKR